MRGNTSNGDAYGNHTQAALEARQRAARLQDQRDGSLTHQNKITLDEVRQMGRR